MTLISARSRSPTTVDDVDAVQQLARLFGVQHRGLAGLDDVLRAADRVGRVGGDDLAGDQPVEQHADGGQVLLDRRLLEILAERLDVGGDVQRLDVGELADLVVLAPGEEPARRRGNRPSACSCCGWWRRRIPGSGVRRARRRRRSRRHQHADAVGDASQRPLVGWHKSL